MPPRGARVAEPRPRRFREREGGGLPPRDRPRGASPLRSQSRGRLHTPFLRAAPLLPHRPHSPATVQRAPGSARPWRRVRRSVSRLRERRASRHKLNVGTDGCARRRHQEGQRACPGLSDMTHNPSAWGRGIQGPRGPRTTGSGTPALLAKKLRGPNTRSVPLLCTELTLVGGLALPDELARIRVEGNERLDDGAGQGAARARRRKGEGRVRSGP
jgi:hypothetical protein